MGVKNAGVKCIHVKQKETLFDFIFKIGSINEYAITKDYIARIPSLQGNKEKSIVVSFHSHYKKEDFIATSRKSNGLTHAKLGES